MYDPVRIPHRPSRRRKVVVLFMIFATLVAIVVTVVRTMPHKPPVDPLTLEDLQVMMIPDATQTALIAASIRARVTAADATPAASPAAAAPAVPACVAAGTPHPWNDEQRANARTIVEVGVALSIPQRGEIVALATAIQESKLYNLGNLGAKNDHDSRGLFQQRPSMGWGTVAQVTDPVFASTAFYLALKSVPRWESLSITVAAQRVQRSAYPNAYAQWVTDATSLVHNVLCNAL